MSLEFTFRVIAHSLFTLSAGILLLALLPRLARSLREAVVASKINRLTLFGEPVFKEGFDILLLRALIYDGVGIENSVTQRLSKLRELSLAMDHRGRTNHFSERNIERFGRKCLQELATIVRDQVASLRPTSRIDSNIVFAKDILGHIANASREASIEPNLSKTRDIEIHFRKNPATVEQIAELLESIGHLVLYRSQAPPGLEARDVDLFTDIVTREKRLRAFVTTFMKSGVGNQAQVQLELTLGKSAMKKATELAEKNGITTAELQAEPFIVLEYLYLDHLKQLITGRWDSFREALPPKSEVVEVLETLSPIRNRLAHGRRLSSSDRKQGRRACDSLDGWLEAAKEVLESHRGFG